MRVMIMIKRDEVNVLQRVSGLPLQILAWGGGHVPPGGTQGAEQRSNGGRFIRALLQGNKGLMMSYIWVNQQHNCANWSQKPLNMALFQRILSNK